MLDTSVVVRNSAKAITRRSSGAACSPPATVYDRPRASPEAAAADVLLVNERASAVDMSLPSKLTSYFSAGLPVLAAVPPRGGTASEVRRSGGGRLVAPEDPAALVQALVALGADPQERARLGERGAEHAARHLNQATSLGRIVEVLQRAIERGPRRG